MSVLAVLTIQFARVIALALTIADFAKSLTDRLILPIVKMATPKDYQVSVLLYHPLFCMYGIDTNSTIVLLHTHFRNGVQ